MSRSRFSKEILSQIEKATNPDRKLGSVSVGKPKVLKYMDQEKIDNPQGINFVIKKKYYNFFRGEKDALSKVSFTSYSGKRYYGSVHTNEGNFVDDGLDANINIHYSVQLYSETDRTVKVKLTTSRSSITVYNNLVEQFSSGNNFFSVGKIEIDLVEGWNTLDIFFYRKSSDGYLKMEGDLGRYISAWREVDFDPPTKPAWHSTAVVSEYIDPKDFGQFQNVLRWKKIPGVVSSSELEDVYGWEVYKSTPTPLTNTSGSTTTIVSGWDTNSFALTGDFRHILPSEGTIYTPNSSTGYTVSGTSYPDGNGSQTIVTISGTFVSPSNGDSIWVDEFNPIFTKINEPSLPFIISGFDREVIHNVDYSYYIKAIDNSPNRNKSEKSIVQTLTAGDFSAPDEVTNLSAVGGYKHISVSCTGPSTSDLRGLKYWIKKQSDDSYPDDELGNKTSKPSQQQNYVIGADESGSSLDPDTGYTIKVQTYDHHDNISTGTETSVTTLSTPPTTAAVSGTLTMTSNRYYYTQGYYDTIAQGAWSIHSKEDAGANVPVVREIEAWGGEDLSTSIDTITEGSDWRLNLTIDGDETEGPARMAVQLDLADGSTVYTTEEFYIDYSAILPTTIKDQDQLDEGDVPGDDRSSRSDTGATLRWDSIEEDDTRGDGARLAYLNVYRSEDESSSNAIKIAQLNSGTTQFDDNDLHLIKNHTYTYWLTATDEAGNESSLVSGTSITTSDNYEPLFKNYIDNSSFERVSGTLTDNELVSWNKVGSPSIVSGTDKYHGNYAVQIDDTNYYQADYVYVDPNDSYTYSAFIKPTSIGDKLSTTVNYFNASGTSISSSSHDLTTSSSIWNRYSTSISSVPNKATHATLDLKSDGNTIEVDGVQWEEGSLSKYVDSRLQSGDRLKKNAIKAHMIETDNLSSIVADIGSITAGNLTLDSSGYIKGGQTDYDTGDGFWLGYDTDAYKLSIGNSSSYALTWDGTTLTTQGTVNATAGYFGDSSNRVAIEPAGLNVGNTGNLRGGQTDYDTGDGFFLGYRSGAYVFSIGSGDNKRLTWDGNVLMISGSVVAGLQSGSEPSIQGWQYDNNLYAEDYNTVGWGPGTFSLLDGNTYNIISGSANISNVTYIYLDLTSSTTEFQTSTTHSDAVGTKKILVGVASPDSDSNKKATYQMFGGAGGVGKVITASEIAADTITGNEVAANTIVANNLSVSQLSAIAADMGTLTAGNITLSSGDSGYIKAGQTSYDTGSPGFFMGYDSGAWKLSLGDPDANKVIWDGSNLQISGTIEAPAGNIGGWEISDNTITGQSDLNSTIQTASSGQRIAISGSDNTLRFFDSTGANVITMDDNIDGLGVAGIGIYKGFMRLSDDNSNYASISSDSRITVYCETSPNAIVSTVKFVSDSDSFGVKGESDIGISGGSGYGRNRIGVWGKSYIIDGSNSDHAIGVYGNASTAGSGNSYAGYFDGDVYIKNDLVVSGSLREFDDTGENISRITVGSTETPTVTSAINALTNSRREIFIPKGEWSFSSELKPAHSCKIHGVGDGSRIYTSSSVKGFVISGVSCALENFNLGGSVSGGYSGIHIAGDTQRVFIKSMIISGWGGYAVEEEDSSSTMYNSVVGNYFDGVSSPAIHFRNGSNSVQGLNIEV